MRRVALCGLLLAGTLAGCVGPANPDPSLRLAPTGVELLPVPTTAAFAGTVAVSWRIHNPLGDPVPATELRFGPAAVADARNLSEASYPFRVAPEGRTEDAVRTVIVQTNLSSVHLRAWARIGGQEWWTREAVISVAGAPFGDPAVNLTTPATAEAGVPFAATWTVANSTGGVTELTALPGRFDETPRPVGAFRLATPMNRSSAAFARNLTLPFPGTWTLVASLNLSGSLVAAHATTVRVREPAQPNVAFIAPVLDAAPGERIQLRFRANGPGGLGAARVLVGAEERAAQFSGARNFTATLFAPNAGPLHVQARVLVDDAPVDSANLSIHVVPREAWSVSLVNYPAEAAPGAQVAVRFRVSGPAADASFAGVHGANRSVLGAGNQLSPANYTGATALADGASPEGAYAVPGMLHVNLTAPAQPGVLYFRARVAIGGISYWSEEGSVRVRP